MGALNTRMRAGLGLLALAALALAAYHPLFPGSFLMDDRRLVDYDNPLVHGTASPFSIWFQSDFSLSTFTFWLQWLAWGQNPAGYHAVNVALHVLSAALIWLLLARLKIPGAWLAAAIFVVHPVCVATVGRIAELKNTLSLPFFLLSLWFYLRWEEDSSRPGGGARWLGCSLAAFVLALLAKTSTVMLPFLLLAFAGWRRGRVTRQDWLRASPYFMLSLGFGVMSIWFQKYQALAGATLEPQSFCERLAVAGRVFWFYCDKALFPAGLIAIYPRWKVDASSLAAFIPLLGCAGAVALCWRFRRSWGRPVLFALACFAFAVFPALGFFDAQFMAKWQVSDHLQYLPLIAPLALAAAALACLPGRTFRRCAAATAVLSLCVMSFERARVFSTEESLFRDTVARNPSAWALHSDLGLLLACQGKQDEAEEHFKASLRIAPQYAEAHVNLGKILFEQGRADEAKEHFQAALKTEPHHPEAHRRLGTILALQEQFAEAIGHLRVALLFSPDVATRLQCATLLHQTGDYSGAAAQFRHALREHPHCVEALNNLALILATAPDEKVRNGAEAVLCAEEASSLPAPKGMCVAGTLAAAYAEAGRFKDAIATAEKAVAAETAAGETAFANMNAQLLARYRAGLPFHEPPPRKSNPCGIHGGG